MKRLIAFTYSSVLALALLGVALPAHAQTTSTGQAPDLAQPSEQAPAKPTPSEGQQTPAPNTPVNITVNRLAGADRYGTAIAITKQLYKDHEAKEVILASGEQFPDAITAANFFHGKRTQPVLLTPAKGLTKEVTEELKRLADSNANVFVIGGEKAIDPKVMDELTALGLKPIRIAGPDRQSTSIEIAQKTQIRGRNGIAIVTPADDFALGVFGASLAVHKDANHLIAFKYAPLQTPVKNFIFKKETRRAIVLGNEFDFSLSHTTFEAIRSNAPVQLPSVVCYRNTSCVESTDIQPPASPQQTVIEKILAKDFGNAKNVVMVASDKPVDGIAATQLAAQLDAPILPVESKFLHRYLGVIKRLGKEDRNFYLIGGEEAIGKEIAETITQEMKR